MDKIREGKALLRVTPAKKVSKKMPVFYNPVMKLNRDLSVCLLNALGKKLQIGLPLAGSGIRGIRFLLETKCVKNISFNDNDNLAVAAIKSNLKLNKLSGSHIHVTQKDANQFLLESTGFDYIDVDPFGSPNPFLDSAIKRISRDGILAVTATDTSALAGSHSDACKRKYWSMPLRNEFMHESGIRILIRKVQLIGAQYEKALTPILAYTQHHYYRIFFSCQKGKERVNKLLKNHSNILYCTCLTRAVATENSGLCTCGLLFNSIGPLWVGKLWDTEVLRKMIGACPNDVNPLLDVLYHESLGTVGFYDIHAIVKRYKLKSIPKTKELLEKIESMGFAAAPTHFAPNTIRTNATLEQLLEIIQSLF
ncbi:MAG: tRNA (guanine(10)-N(2))-dimethyltransferase [Candidatus Woesearchaeota archaeon]